MKFVYWHSSYILSVLYMGLNITWAKSRYSWIYVWLTNCLTSVEILIISKDLLLICAEYGLQT